MPLIISLTGSEVFSQAFSLPFLISHFFLFKPSRLYLTKINKYNLCVLLLYQKNLVTISDTANSSDAQSQFYCCHVVTRIYIARVTMCAGSPVIQFVNTRNSNNNRTSICQHTPAHTTTLYTVYFLEEGLPPPPPPLALFPPPFPPREIVFASACCLFSSCSSLAVCCSWVSSVERRT